ncbi:hypothetical protein G3T14_13520 [Methylobacterium sp. BTF04]|uniref:hypothetical protein n=1 Tax=Methylobacterium sp. BTF04 TaxID=2708300 RepID=UPI0013D3B5DA|nr:hypothetical protein [Methylobacterium sp. BTF04]NEU13149.1 hypothetical protein [Methylobacterium sp. BTF04]
MPVLLPVSAVVTEATRPPSTSFIVGQDPQGHWVAVETHGLGGGLFRSRHDALHYAVDLTGHRPDAVVIATDRIELRI